MLLIDDILTSPFRGLLWIFKEIHQAAQQEQAGEGEALTARLSELYMRLETGEITEAEFEAQEKVLLDRLDRIQESGPIPEAKPRPGKIKKRVLRGARSVAKTRGRAKTGVGGLPYPGCSLGARPIP